MLSLPSLPTDRLYKLITLAGICLYVGAFVVMYSNNKPFEDTGNAMYAKLIILRDRLEDAGLKPEVLPEDTTKENVLERYTEYRSLIRTLKNDPALAIQLRDMNEQLFLARLKNRVEVRRGGFGSERRDVYTLAILGTVLMMAGTLWWYLDERRTQALPNRKPVRSRKHTQDDT